MLTIKRHPIVVGVLAAVLVASGVTIGLLTTSPPAPQPHRYGVPAASNCPTVTAGACNVPDRYRSTDCVASNWCAVCGATPADWIDGDNVTPKVDDLTKVISQLPTGTTVDFATDGCYELNGGINLSNGDPSISFDGNPSGVEGENAFIYDADTADDGYDEAGQHALLPIFQESAGTGAVIQHFFLRGSDATGAYPQKYPDRVDNSGILLLGTQNTIVNDVRVSNAWGDGLTVQINDPGGHPMGTTQNLLVENFQTAYTGRIGISPIAVQGAEFCGINIGPAGLGNDAWDFEDDFTGANEGASGVTITGGRCQHTTAATGTVIAQGCYFNGFTTFQTNPGATGPILFDGCVMTGEGSGGAISIGPECQMISVGTTSATLSPGTVTSIPASATLGTNTAISPGSITRIPLSAPLTIAAGVHDIIEVDGVQFTAGPNVAPTGQPGASAEPGATTIPVQAQHQGTTITAGNTVVDSSVTRTVSSGSLIQLQGSGGGLFTTSTSASVGALTIPVDSTSIGSTVATGTNVITTGSVCATSSVPNGQITFSHDQIMCGSSGVLPCVQVFGPFSVAVRGSTILAGITGDNKVVWQATNSFITQGLFGAQVNPASDCVSGFLGNAGASPPFSMVAPTLSAMTVVNTLYYRGDRSSCPLATEITSTPATFTTAPCYNSANPVVSCESNNAMGTIAHGTATTDTATVTGAAGPGSPTGTVHFYICGPTSTPQPCTSTATSAGTGNLAATGDGMSSTATSSPAFTPSAAGYWCFAAYYPQTALDATGYYQPSSDTSQPGSGYDGTGPLLFGSGYDGCFHAT